MKSAIAFEARANWYLSVAEKLFCAALLSPLLGVVRGGNGEPIMSPLWTIGIFAYLLVVSVACHYVAISRLTQLEKMKDPARISQE